MKKNLSIITLFLSFSTCIASHTDLPFSHTFEPQAFRRVHFAVDQGRVQIDHSQDVASVTCTPDPQTLSQCIIKVGIVDGDLHIVSKKKGWFSRGCAVAWHISVPSDKAVSVSMGTGEVKTGSYQGHLNLRLGTGRLDLQSALSSLNIKAGTLNGQVHNLKGDSHFTCGSGALDFFWSEVPAVLSHLHFTMGKCTVKLHAPEQTIFDMRGMLARRKLEKISSHPATSSSPHIRITGKSAGGAIEVHSGGPILDATL